MADNLIPGSLVKGGDGTSDGGRGDTGSGGCQSLCGIRYRLSNS